MEACCLTIQTELSPFFILHLSKMHFNIIVPSKLPRFRKWSLLSRFAEENFTYFMSPVCAVCITQFMYLQFITVKSNHQLM
jgi:hypothetical protein